MSHIFDALQRSQGERSSDANLSSISAATELLERAERQAKSQWDAELAVAQTENSIALECETPFHIDADLPVAPGVADLVDAKLSPVDERLEFFRRCKSLDISVTPQNRLVSVTEKDSPAAEAFRFLSVRLRHLRRERKLQKLLITSTIPQEGKSVVSANLACALSSGTQQRTLLLEGDVRRPSLSKIFGLNAYPGICEWLQGGGGLTNSIYRLDQAGIWLLPAGIAPANPLEILQSGRLPALMEELTALFDWIIIDSPPVLPLADTSIWTRMADGILLVTRQGTTQKRYLKRGLEGLESAKVIGAVLNSSRNAADNDYYSYRHPSEGTVAN